MNKFVIGDRFYTPNGIIKITAIHTELNFFNNQIVTYDVLDEYGRTSPVSQSFIDKLPKKVAKPILKVNRSKYLTIKQL